MNAMKELSSRLGEIFTPSQTDAKADALATANAHLSNAGEPEVSSSFRNVPLDLIDAESQVRQTSGLDSSLDDLAASIREHGLLQPIVLRPNGAGRYTIIAGHRRTFAAQLAGLETIPAKITRELKQSEADEIQLVENIQRENLNIEETAAGLANLFDTYKNLNDVARVVGKSKSWVSKHMAPAMPNFGALARKLLADDVSTDIEFLTIVSSIEKQDPDAETMTKIEDGIKAGTFGRKDARRLLAKLKKPEAPETPDANQQENDESGENGDKSTPPKKLPAYVVAWYTPTGDLVCNAFPSEGGAQDYAASLSDSYSITAVRIDNPAAI